VAYDPEPTVQEYTSYSSIVVEPHADIVEIEQGNSNHFLEDVDYLFYILENNFPLFYAAERVLGIDVAEIKASTRLVFEGGTTSDNNGLFFHMLQNHFFSNFNGFGHLFMFDENFYHTLLAADLEPWRGILDNPASHAFYGVATNQQAAAAEIEIPVFPNNVQTQIIEEGRIAHMHISTFVHTNFEHDAPIILEFFESVADYEHLIIDIRGNGGGSSGFFDNLMLPLLINEPVVYNRYNFIMGGEHVWLFYGDDSPDWESYSPIPDGLLNSFPLLLPEEAEQFTHYSRMTINFEPSENAVGFQGKIWMLIDERNGSATWTAPRMAQYTGFATLVGAPTGGGGGRTPLVAVLPNSGIAVYFQGVFSVDEMGRNGYEYGVQPDILNFEGMDALQTVLTLIAEGIY